jgi:hypothetical protein
MGTGKGIEQEETNASYNLKELSLSSLLKERGCGRGEITEIM